MALFRPRRTPDAATWQAVLALPVLAGLGEAERRRLHVLTEDVLTDKHFSGAAGIEVDTVMATRIAAFAALPALEIGLAAYADFREIIVYPGEFIYEGEEVDEIGVVHPVRHARSGEAMHGGPVVLSWEDVLASGQGEGYNVVIHEFVHKLDIKTGAVDGLPRLPADMSVTDWAAAWQAAYADLRARSERGEEGAIDPYAGEDAAECFAVLSEYFFEAPAVLRASYPAVYAQLCSFYRQNPQARMESPS